MLFLPVIFGTAATTYALAKGIFDIADGTVIIAVRTSVNSPVGQKTGLIRFFYNTLYHFIAIKSIPFYARPFGKKKG